MRPHRFLVALLLLAFLTAHATDRTDQFTPLVASPLTASATPFPGTDGRLHIVYELVLTNTSPTPASLQKIEVVDAANPATVLASYSGQQLLACLRTTAATPVQSPTIEFNGTRLFLISVTMDGTATPPARLLHHIEVLGAAMPDRTPTTPVALSYSIAPLELSHKLPKIGPPLSGNGWVAVNGCCEPGVHRASSLSVNGKIYYAQRFAIDWMRLDDAGRLVHGDVTDVNNYSSYGADVLAVADGSVVDELNDLTDQKPPTLPDRKTITLQNVDGNHVVLDLGDGVYAFYAHMQKDSVTVHVGDRVKRGQVLGKLGNTGNTSAPHLHFHLMDGPSVLGSNGIPYVIDSFALAGQVSAEDFAKATGVEGDFGKGLFPTPSPRHDQFPLDLSIVNFPATR